MTNHDFVCELCCEQVLAHEVHVRIGCDAMTKTEDGEYVSAIGGEVMVFAVFHNECVTATIDRADCDDVPFVWQARQLVDEIANRGVVLLSMERKARAARIERPSLVLLQGGLSA